VASRVQVPAAISDTVAPVTVQTGMVRDAKLTASADEAVAVRVKGTLPNALFGRLANVMVWVAGVTVKLWLTGVAAA